MAAQPQRRLEDSDVRDQRVPSGLLSQGKALLAVVHSAAVTKRTDRGLINSRHLCLTVLEAGQPTSRCQLGWVLGRDGFQVADGCLLLCPHMVDRG